MKRSRAEEEALKALYPQPDDRRRELYQNAEPALREKLDWIQAWWEREYRHHALSLYELGRQCKVVYDDVSKRRGRRYGAEAVDVIEEYFQLDEGLIYRALRLANAFSEQEIQEATSHPKADGEPVSTRDLLILARVEDRALRKELLAQAIAKAWRAADLAEAVDRAVGKEETEKPDGRGRPLAKPRNFDDVVRQQEQAAKNFVNRTVHVWERPEHSLLAKAADLATDEYTEERAGKLKAHAELMDQLAQEARERADEARHVYEQFTAILSQRQKSSSEADEQKETDLPPPLGPRLPGSRSKGKATRRKRKANESGNEGGS